MQIWKLWDPMIVEGYQEVIEMPMEFWPQCEKKQDFSVKIDRSLSTHLPGQSVDCVR